MALGAGTGLVLLGRWYWWRGNAFSELSAMLAASAVSIALDPGVRSVLGSAGPDEQRAHHGRGRPPGRLK